MDIQKTQIEENIRKNVLPQRMYCLALYNLSAIQQGIQSLHAVVEYGMTYGDILEYKRWSEIDKTVIILNGGSSKTLMTHIEKLNKFGIKWSLFNEPDLYGNITAVCFLVDERIWDNEKYPDKPQPEPIRYGSTLVSALYKEFNFDAYLESIGGEKNFQFKQYLNKLKLA